MNMYMYNKLRINGVTSKSKEKNEFFINWKKNEIFLVAIWMKKEKSKNTTDGLVIW